MRRFPGLGSLSGVRLVLALGLAVLMGWASLGAGQASAEADVETTAVAVAAFSPATLQLALGEQATVDLRVSGVQDLCGYSFQLSFDPGVIEMIDLDGARSGVNLLQGDFLDPSYAYAPTNVVSNTIGVVDMAVAELSGGQPGNGSGTLASLRFRAKSLGDAHLVITAFSLADGSALPIAFTVETPSYIVSDGPTSVPTVGPSPTPTYSPTAGPSPTASHTPTPTQTTMPTATPTDAAVTVEPTPYFFLSPPVQSVRPGEQITVAIQTSYVDELGGVQVELTWDPTMLRVVDALPSVAGVQILPGDLFAGYYVYRPPNGNVVDNGRGWLRYVLVLLSPDRSAGAWTVAEVTFEGLNEGETQLWFDREETWMGHPDYANVWCGWEDAVLTVGEPTPTITNTPQPTVPVETLTPTPTFEGMAPWIHIPLILRDATS